MYKLLLFYHRCQGHVNPQRSPWTSRETCLVSEGVIHRSYTRYAVWSTCPQNWTEKSVRQKCQDEDQSDLFRNLPVFDSGSHETYKNIFCARCNGVVNTTYWKLQFNCKKSLNMKTFYLGDDKIILPQNCWVEKFPKPYHLLYQLKQCIPRFLDCHTNISEKNGSYCQTECLRYAFPVCSKNIRFRNPQCALCNGFKLNNLDSRCESDNHQIIPPLTILFDFSSTSKYSVEVVDLEEYVFKRNEKQFSCRVDEVFDPYVGNCKKIVSAESRATSHGPESNATNHTTKVIGEIKAGPDDRFDGGHLPSKHNKSKSWNANCTAVIAFNKTEYVQLSNGSVYLKPHDRIYNNLTYTIRDSRLLLCVNFKRNFSRTEKEGGKHKITKTLPSLQLLSSIGCIVSMVSLVLLLITYILFAELRNLTGKIIINLALSLLLYQSVLFSAVKTETQEICLAVAVLLHFFVLSSFTWMSVMAYDVRRIFTNVSGIT